MMLNQNEILRYSRHLPIIGLDGQKKLKTSKVLCIGAGGLGSAALPYLTAAGIGILGIVDGDAVDLSNLQRQVLFKESQIGINKAKAAAENLAELNSNTRFYIYDCDLSTANAQTIISTFDVVIDATDNFEARYLINQVCREHAIPLVSASIFQFDAQLSVFNYHNGPCYECLYPTKPCDDDFIPNCAVAGVFGVLPGVAGALQATEALKILLSKGDILSGKLLSIDLLSMHMKTFQIDKSKTCSRTTCSTNVKANNFNKHFATTNNLSITALTPTEFNALSNKDDYILIDVREIYEREICHIGGIHIPLSQLTEHYETLDKNKKYLAYCKGGVRSLQATKFLLEQNFTHVINLTGGVLAWAKEIDSSLCRY